MSFFHGIRSTEVTTGPRPIKPYTSSIIGLVGTAPTADDSILPLNEPKSFSRIDDAIAAVGKTGTLIANLDVIRDQCQPRIVLVRVAVGADEDAQRANTLAGITALESATSAGADQPRILIAGFLDADEAVANALVSTAQHLNGTTYVTAVGDDKEAVKIYRDSFGQREIELVWPNFLGADRATGAIVERPTVALHAALRALIDETQGFHHSKSNIPVNGVLGLVHDVSFSLNSVAADSAFLNENEITTLVQRNGWRLWGLRTCSSEPLFAFEVYVRTAQILKEVIADGLAWASDKPMSLQLIKDIIETINAEFRRLQAAGRILGGEAWFDTKQNTTTSMSGGQLVIRYKYTRVPPLEDLELVQEITDEYLTDYIVNFTRSD